MEKQRSLAEVAPDQRLHPGAHSSSTTEEEECANRADESMPTEIEKMPNIISMFDPSVRDVVMTTVKGCLRSVVMLSLIMWFILALMYGVAWDPKSNYANVQIAVADLDGGLIGQTLLAIMEGPSVPFTVTLIRGPTTLQHVMDRVNAGDFNAAIVANANATQALLSALYSTSATYTSASATSFIFDEGRGGGTMASLLRSTIPLYAKNQINSAVADALIAENSGVSIAALNPTALLTPVGNTEVNLHRVQFSGETSAAGLGFIDNWVITMIASSIILAVYRSWSTAGIRLDHQIYAHCASVAAVTCFLALWPPSILLAFGAPLPASTYFTMWIFVWFAMLTFASIVLSLFRALGPAAGAGAHSLFLLINFVASPAMAPFELIYPPFRLAYALPFQNAIEGSRTVIFGSYNVLYRNLPVLAAWMLLGAAVLAWHARRAAREVEESRRRRRMGSAAAGGEGGFGAGAGADVEACGGAPAGGESGVVGGVKSPPSPLPLPTAAQLPAAEALPAAAESVEEEAPGVVVVVRN